MYVETPIGTTQYINRLLKDFLWGFSMDGSNRKFPLIAWDKIMQPRKKGGLGFKDYYTHSHALLSKWISKALDNPSIEWASLFLTLSHNMTWKW